MASDTEDPHSDGSSDNLDVGKVSPLEQFRLSEDLKRKSERAMARMIRQYRSRGASFPVDKVKEFFVFDGTLIKMAADRIKMAADGSLHPQETEIGLSLDELMKLLSALGDARQLLGKSQAWWQPKHPHLLDGLDGIEDELKGILETEEWITEWCRGVLGEQHWVADTISGEVKAIQTPGAGNRPRLLRNELACRLYDCLRKPFDEGWPEYAGTKNPKLLREHISIILTPFFHKDEIDPKAHSPLYEALKAHANKTHTK